ncbi:MAG: hypothetical protein UV60_C0002G0028 [Parcubacteria group bacterium GW2011_GWA2_43_11]|nr:MAG: hypothetical protein UV60_C0002G0028 [Parcubacteria group bacterium GW2011_GWA2_43_11]
MKSVPFIRDKEHISKKMLTQHTACSVCGSLSKEFDEREGLFEEYTNPLSLDALFVHNPASTFFIEVEGNKENFDIGENTFLGIHAGDVLTIDRALTPTLGRLVLAVRDGAFALCRFTEHEGQKFLICGSESSTALVLEDGGEVSIWGVVSAVSRRM